MDFALFSRADGPALSVPCISPLCVLCKPLRELACVHFQPLAKPSCLALLERHPYAMRLRDMFWVTAPLRAPAFLHIFVASCCRRCAGVGGRGKGGNSAVTNASDAAAFLE